MLLNLRTISDFDKLLLSELSGLYPKEEIRSIGDIIIKTVTGRSRLQHLTDYSWNPDPETIKKLSDIASQLKTGRPVQYVLGEAYFYGIRLKVNEHTLIPRQETEELVHLIISENMGFSGEILDIGTGSGCIAIALALNIPGANVTATDVSPGAIKTAETNAADNAAAVAFLCEDVLVHGKQKKKQFGIIVSNPPYIRQSEKAVMHLNVTGFEPHSALFVPDNDPLVFYRAIFSYASEHLADEGKIYVEINEALGEETAKLAQTYNINNVNIIKDINGKNRFISGCR